MADPFNLERFVTAQEGVHPTVLRELESGKKVSHWMWFAFPQLKGLGRTPTAEFYGIASLEEAKAYLKHPVLGKRLLEYTALVNEHKELSPDQIFGFPDNLKFRSSMTLFAVAAEAGSLFQQALDYFYKGEMDELTLKLLQR